MNLKMHSGDSNSKITILHQKIFIGSMISTISLHKLGIAIPISITAPCMH